MTCITKLLEMKGDKEFLPYIDEAVIEGGGNYKGFEYLITFVNLGHRCGYVAIAEPKSEDYSYIDCHGGITFQERHHLAKDLLSTPCNDLWIGFDCAHHNDKQDFETAQKYFGKMDKGMLEIFELTQGLTCTVHKSYGFVEEQCQYIIDQLI